MRCSFVAPDRAPVTHAMDLGTAVPWEHTASVGGIWLLFRPAPHFQVGHTAVEPGRARAVLATAVPVRERTGLFRPALRCPERHRVPVERILASSPAPPQGHTRRVQERIALRQAQRDSSQAAYKNSAPEHSLPDCHAERACPDEGSTESLPHSPTSSIANTDQACSRRYCASASSA